MTASQAVGYSLFTIHPSRLVGLKDPRAPAANSYNSPMKRTLRLILLASVLSVSLIAAASPNVVGHWKGKLHLGSMPSTQNDQQKQFMAQMVKMMSKMTINLDLKRDHTYSVNVTGLPQNSGKQSDTSDHGTWTQSGNKLILKGGKHMQSRGKQSQEFSVSSDGKKITASDPAGHGTVVFTKG